MRNIRTSVFAGIAALAAAGAAVAANYDNHVMKVDLPDGSVARIEYKGDVAPKVTVAPALNFVPVRWFDPFVAAPFREVDRITAEMDRQADMMMRQVRALQMQPTARNGKLDLTGFGTLPAGTVSYSFVSTGTGAGTCSRSVQVTSFGPGRQPKIVSDSSGDCRDTPSGPTAASLRRVDQGVAPATGRTASDHEGKSPHTT